MTRSITPMESKQSPTVAVWTPWGVQSVPKQELKPSAMKRLAGHLGNLPKLQAGKAIRA